MARVWLLKVNILLVCPKKYVLTVYTVGKGKEGRRKEEKIRGLSIY
jgi:hypothetical protein